MDRHHKRVAEILNQHGLQSESVEEWLVVHVPVTATQTFPVTLEVVELAADLYQVHLWQRIHVPTPEDPDLLLELMVFSNTANSEMSIARCTVLPEIDEELEAEGNGADDENISLPSQLACTLDASFFIGGLKQNHLKLLLATLEAFVEDAGACMYNFVQLHPTLGKGDTEATEQPSSGEPTNQ